MKLAITGININMNRCADDLRHEGANLLFRFRPHPTTLPQLPNKVTVTQRPISQGRGAYLVGLEEGFNVVEKIHARTHKV